MKLVWLAGIIGSARFDLLLEKGMLTWECLSSSTALIPFMLTSSSPPNEHNALPFSFTF